MQPIFPAGCSITSFDGHLRPTQLCMRPCFASLHCFLAAVFAHQQACLWVRRRPTTNTAEVPKFAFLTMASAPNSHAAVAECEGITLQSAEANGNKRRRVDADRQRQANAPQPSAQSVPIDGPTTLEQVLAWPQFVVCRLLDHAASNGRGSSFKLALQEVTSNIVLTTSYSGMGCAEMVLPLLAKSLQSFGITAQMAPYSATDYDPTCRRMLLSHKKGSRPEHVFGDILERIPRDVRARLEGQGT